MTNIAEVIPLYESNYRDPAATLRVIADEIEAGNYGDVLEIGIAMNTGTSLEIFGTGPNSDAGTMCLLFTAALHKFARTIDR